MTEDRRHRIALRFALSEGESAADTRDTQGTVETAT